MVQEHDDTDLVAALVHSDAHVSAPIYRRHTPTLLRVCTGIVRNRATAEEIVQDTWVAVLKGASQFEGRSSLASWLFAIALNTARSRAKRDGRSVSFDEFGDDRGFGAAFDGHGRWSRLPDLWDNVDARRIIEGRDMLSHVNTAIDTLPEAQRAVLILWSHKDLTSDAICDMLEITPGNLRVLLHRARTGLRKSLDHLVTRTTEA